MNKKLTILSIVIITGIVLATVIFYAGPKRAASQIVKKNLTGDFKIENVQKVQHNGENAYRVRVNYKNKFLGICGEMIEIKNGLIYTQDNKMFLSIPESEVKKILEGKGNIKKIKFGNFQISEPGKKCRLNNTYKVLLKLNQKEDKFTHKEIYINRFGNILYSRPAFFGPSLGGGNTWGYGPGKFGQL